VIAIDVVIEDDFDLPIMKPETALSKSGEGTAHEQGDGMHE
jgi:hypothetical protein